MKKRFKIATDPGKFGVGIRRLKKRFKNLIWKGLGLHLGGFGRGLAALGASWVLLEAHFFVLVFGMVFKSALGGLWARLWANFRGAGTNFGRVWGRFWEGLGGIFEHSC